MTVEGSLNQGRSTALCCAGMWILQHAVCVAAAVAFHISQRLIVSTPAA
jgi:hypothetical protein